MYGEEFTREPTDLADFWALIDHHFDLIDFTFMSHPLESREDALSGKYRGSTPSKGPAVRAIRYRPTHSDYDNRQEFYDMAWDLLPIVAQQIHDREFSISFVHNWGKLMYCHGYIASYIFDDSDDLHAVRAGSVRIRDPHRLWLARQFVPLFDQGHSRVEAEEIVTANIQRMIREGCPPDGWSLPDFKKLLKSGELASTYDAKHFTKKEMRLLIAKKR